MTTSDLDIFLKTLKVPTMANAARLSSLYTKQNEAIYEGHDIEALRLQQLIDNMTRPDKEVEWDQ